MIFMGKQAIRLNQEIIDEYTKTLRHGFNNKKEVGKSLEINKDLQRQQLNQITKNYSYSSGEKEKLRESVVLKIKFMSSKINEILNGSSVLVNKKNKAEQIVKIKIDRIDEMTIEKAFKNGKINGEYLENVNALIIRKDEKSTIIHEIFHYLSTKKLSDDIILSGFRVVNFSKKTNEICDIGIGLTEGCTEYFTKRVCGNKNTKVYPYFVKKIEAILKYINEADLLSCYLRHDILGFIKLLENKKFRKDEIYDLIIGMDYYFYSTKSLLDIFEKYKAEFYVKSKIARIFKNVDSRKDKELIDDSKKDIKVLIKQNLNNRGKR